MASRRPRSTPVAVPAPTAAEAATPWPCAREKGAYLSLLSVSVVPNAKRTEVVGLHDGALRVRLAAPPVDGKANDTLTDWVADQLGLPKRAVRLLRGPASRSKQLEIDAPLATLTAWLGGALAAAA